MRAGDIASHPGLAARIREHRRVLVVAVRETAIEAACGHLGSAISQSIASDDQIIMDHVRAAYELLKVARADERKVHDPSPAETRFAEASVE